MREMPREMGTVNEQYKNASNLEARINIHERFSTNRKEWFIWLFEQMEIEPNSKVLELGCGNGNFWLKNINRIPESWKLKLSDFSPGMLREAKQKLQSLSSAQFKQIDIQNIPFEDNSFDIVVANFMLYHVPDRKQAIQEVRRVLKPDGCFYASTIGQNHLAEFGELLKEFDPTIEYLSAASPADEFGLETGLVQLEPFFSTIQLKTYPDSLEITEVRPILDYLLSTNTDLNYQLARNKLDALSSFLEKKLIENKGPISITKSSGLFVAK
jgi:ubiquinone/menaquinone biosynthesis C-methylase UbiE